MPAMGTAEFGVGSSPKERPARAWRISLALMASLAVVACATDPDLARTAPSANATSASEDAARADLELRMRSQRLRAQARLQLLELTLDLRIKHATQLEYLRSQIASRVSAGVARGSEMELMNSMAAGAAIAWRSAHVERHESLSDFRALYGTSAPASPEWDSLLPASGTDLLALVAAADRIAAQQAWIRRQSAIELVALADSMVSGAERVRDAYLQQWEIGQRSLQDVLNSQAQLLDALLGRERTRTLLVIAGIEILTLTRRLENVPPPAAGPPQTLAPSFEDEVRAIDVDIRNKVQERTKQAPGRPPPRHGSIIEPGAGAEVWRVVTAIEGRAMLVTRSGHQRERGVRPLKVGDVVVFSVNDVVTWPGAVVHYGAFVDRDPDSISRVPNPIAAVESDPVTAPGASIGAGPEAGIRPTASHACAPAGGVTVLPRLQWPPWPATDEQRIDPGGRKKLGEVADFLSGALDRLLYVRHYAFAAIPGSHGEPAGGFAIVTDLEQIQADGSPLKEDVRWLARLPRAGELGLMEFIRALAVAPAGHYRVIVFVVTDAPHHRGGAMLVDDRVLRTLALCGPTELTDATAEMRALRALPVTPETQVRALVYQFTKRAEVEQARFVKPGLSARRHLEKVMFQLAAGS